MSDEVVVLPFVPVTPMVGAALTLLFTVPDRGLLIYLGVFAGFLLYLCIYFVVPNRHQSWGKVWVGALFGVGVWIEVRI